MRKDAARNHAAVLAAAARLITERGLDFAMDEVATIAGVGKGTVFRRFGDREGLVRAVAEQGAEQWRAESRELAGADHLPAAERVVTFMGTLFDHVLSSLPLVLALERESGPESGCDGGYLESHARLSALLAGAGVDDPDVRAHVLLAHLRADVLHHLVHRCGLGAGPVRAQILTLVQGTLARETLA